MPQIVNYDQVKNRDLQKTILIDVRNPNELKEDGIIPNSKNIPLPQLLRAFGELNNEQFLLEYGFAKPELKDEIIFSCRSGKRAEQAAELLLEQGYENVKYYKGSFNDWKTHQKYQ